jgi:hypothetical protein
LASPLVVRASRGRCTCKPHFSRSASMQSFGGVSVPPTPRARARPPRAGAATRPRAAGAATRPRAPPHPQAAQWRTVRTHRRQPRRTLTCRCCSSELA